MNENTGLPCRLGSSNGFMKDRKRDPARKKRDMNAQAKEASCLEQRLWITGLGQIVQTVETQGGVG